MGDGENDGLRRRNSRSEYANAAAQDKHRIRHPSPARRIYPQRTLITRSLGSEPTGLCGMPCSRCGMRCARYLPCSWCVPESRGRHGPRRHPTLGVRITPQLHNHPPGASSNSRARNLEQGPHRLCRVKWEGRSQVCARQSAIHCTLAEFTRPPSFTLCPGR